MKNWFLKGILLALISIPAIVLAQELPSAGRQNQEAFVPITKAAFDSAGQINKIDCWGSLVSKYECERGIYVADYIPNYTERKYSLCFKGRDSFAPNQTVLNNTPKVVYADDGFWLVLTARGSQSNPNLKWQVIPYCASFYFEWMYNIYEISIFYPNFSCRA